MKPEWSRDGAMSRFNGRPDRFGPGVSTSRDPTGPGLTRVTPDPLDRITGYDVLA